MIPRFEGSKTEGKRCKERSEWHRKEKGISHQYAVVTCPTVLSPLPWRNSLPPRYYHESPSGASNLERWAQSRPLWLTLLRSCCITGIFSIGTYEDQYRQPLAILTSYGNCEFLKLHCMLYSVRSYATALFPVSFELKCALLTSFLLPVVTSVGVGWCLQESSLQRVVWSYSKGDWQLHSFEVAVSVQSTFRTEK